MRKYVKIDPCVDQYLAASNLAAEYGSNNGHYLSLDNGENYDARECVMIEPTDFVVLRDILNELIDVLGLEKE